MLNSGTDPESYITEYTLVHEDKWRFPSQVAGLEEARVREVTRLEEQRLQQVEKPPRPLGPP